MENKLQYTLANYEATPPSLVWDDIELALDHQMAPHAATLAAFQQAPPSHVWDKIESALPAQQEEKVVPLYNRRSNFLRYAAAAAVLLILTAAITLWINKSDDKTEIAIQTPTKTKEHTVDTGATTDSEQNNEVVQQRPIPSKEVNTNNATVKNTKAGGRYLTRADEEGKKVRVSKKVASVFNCADNIASANSIRCKEDIESLRQKISASLISPSGDFSGLMDMIKTLEENE